METNRHDAHGARSGYVSRGVLATLGAISGVLVFGVLGHSDGALAGPKIRASIQVVVACTLADGTLTVNVGAEKKELDAPDPIITEELVTLEKRIRADLTTVADLYDTENTGGHTANSVQNLFGLPDPLVAFGDLPISFEVDLCASPIPDLSDAKALSVAAEITISNASDQGETADKTFFARCKVLGLPSC